MTRCGPGGSESITDGYLDGYPESLVPWIPSSGKESDQNPVGDLRVSGSVSALPGLVALRLVLVEGARSYRCELAGPGAEAGRDSVLEGGAFAAPASDLPARLPYCLPAGRAVRFAFENLDDRLTLELDGQAVLALELQPAEDQTSSVSLALEGEGAELAELMVARDIYYTTPSSEPFEVAAGHYFMLGDNTQDSSDSREWRYVVFEHDHHHVGLEGHAHAALGRKLGLGREITYAMEDELAVFHPSIAHPAEAHGGVPMEVVGHRHLIGGQRDLAAIPEDHEGPRRSVLDHRQPRHGRRIAADVGSEDELHE